MALPTRAVGCDCFKCVEGTARSSLSQRLGPETSVNISSSCWYKAPVPLANRSFPRDCAYHYLICSYTAFIYRNTTSYRLVYASRLPELRGFISGGCEESLRGKWAERRL